MAAESADGFNARKIVLTGAAGIFGTRIATYFAKRGASLYLSDARGDRLEELAARCEGAASVHTHVTSLEEESSIRDLAAAVARDWQAPDLVINNAGVYPRGRLMEIEAREWDRVFSVNLRAPFLVTRELARLMIAAKRGGSIINISSGAARRMNVDSVPYCTSKTALERLSKGFALELASHGIRVNVVEPGFAPGSEVSPLTDDYVARMIDKIPLKRTSGPEDAAAAIAFLASAEAGFVTGAVLSVDGGNSISGS